MQDGAHGHGTSVLSGEALPWSLQRILQGHVLILRTLDDVPEDQATDREFYARLGIHSMLAVPLIVNRQVVGVGGFVTVERGRNWRDDEVHDLRILAGVLACAAARRDAMTEIARRELEIARTGELASVGSYSSTSPSCRPERGPRRSNPA